MHRIKLVCAIPKESLLLKELCVVRPGDFGASGIRFWERQRFEEFTNPSLRSDHHKKQFEGVLRPTMYMSVAWNFGKRMMLAVSIDGALRAKKTNLKWLEQLAFQPHSLKASATLYILRQITQIPPKKWFNYRITPIFDLITRVPPLHTNNYPRAPFSMKYRQRRRYTMCIVIIIIHIL